MSTSPEMSRPEDIKYRLGLEFTKSDDSLGRNLWAWPETLTETYAVGNTISRISMEGYGVSVAQFYYFPYEDPDTTESSLLLEGALVTRRRIGFESYPSTLLLGTGAFLKEFQGPDTRIASDQILHGHSALGVAWDYVNSLETTLEIARDKRAETKRLLGCVAIVANPDTQDAQLVVAPSKTCIRSVLHSIESVLQETATSESYRKRLMGYLKYAYQTLESGGDSTLMYASSRISVLPFLCQVAEHATYIEAS